jgi:hypothetical protein
VVSEQLKFLALKLLVKVRQDECFYGAREPMTLVLSTTRASFEAQSTDAHHSRRSSRSVKLGVAVSRRT